MAPAGIFEFNLSDIVYTVFSIWYKVYCCSLSNELADENTNRNKCKKDGYDDTKHPNTYKLNKAVVFVVIYTQSLECTFETVHQVKCQSTHCKNVQQY